MGKAGVVIIFMKKDESFLKVIGVITTPCTKDILGTYFNSYPEKSIDSLEPEAFCLFIIYFFNLYF